MTTSTPATTRTVGELLRAAGYTQTEAAAHLHLGRQALADRYRGRSRWQVAELVTIADLLGMSLDDLARIATR